VLKQFITTLFVFLFIDLVWLGFIAKKIYDQLLTPFERTLNWLPAVLTYLLLASGIFIFVLPFANNNTKALLYGALFGLITYGVYDLTNLATLKNWPTKLVVIDMIWGSFLCALTALIVVNLVKKW
jgi:uncharacterized membrane protein